MESRTIPAVSRRRAYVDLPDPEGPHMKITRLTARTLGRTGVFVSPDGVSGCRLRPPVEADGAVGESGGVVAGVVDDAVVAMAQETGVVEVGRAAGRPGGVVVGVAGSGWQVAALGGAAVVAQGEGEALGGGVEAAGAAEVEDLGGAAEDGGDDAGLAGQAAGLAGADAGAGVQGRGGEAAEERARLMVTTTVAVVPPLVGRASAG